MDVTYDASGNATQSTLSGAGDWQTITSRTTYTGDKNTLASTVDANNHSMSYSYASAAQLMRGTPSIEKDGRGVETHHDYNYENGRRFISYMPGILSVNYDYINGRLSEIRRGGFLPNDKSNKLFQRYNFFYDPFGNLERVNIGDQSMETYTYGQRNGNLIKRQYGNGMYADYSYTFLDYLQTATYNDGTKYAYTYTGDGALHSVSDSSTGQQYVYDYDTLGRLINYTEKDSNGVFQYGSHTYDMANRMTKFSYAIPGITPSNGRYDQYTFDANNGNLTSLRGADGDTLTYTYSPTNLLTSKLIVGNTMYRVNYGYKTGASINNLTSQVSWKQYFIGTLLTGFTYDYDAVGNITQEHNKFDGIYNNYTYDNQKQLTSASITNDSGIQKYDYVYDTFGNIRSKTYSLNGAAKKTDTYTYGNSEWVDLLTAYNSSPITYDEIGNPLSYYDGTSFTWEKGRRLSKAENTQKCLTVAYTYDVDGTRIGKTVTKDGVTTAHRYYVQDSKIVAEKRGNDTLELFYDETGAPFALIFNGKKYYYVTNLQGDVMRIIEPNGNTNTVYNYDAWGNVTYSDGELKDINPLRYRGYYYDTETNLYYLNSRYYDPATCRFINSDDVDVLTASLGSPNQDNNLFAYCDNNPVMRRDDSGEIWNFVVGAVVGAGFSAVTQVVSNAIADEKLSNGLISATLLGAAGGALAASGVGVVASVLGNAGISLTGSYANQAITNKSFTNVNIGAIATDTIVGGITGRIGGSGMGKAVNIKTLNINLTKKVTTLSKKVITQGVKYYVSQTKTVYKQHLIKPMARAAIGGAVYSFKKAVASRF